MRRSRVNRMFGGVACVLAALLAVAACGSSTATSTSSVQSASAGTPVEASSRGQSADSDFAAKVAQYKRGVPAQFGGPTVKVAAKPGVKLAVIACARSLSGCEIPLEGATKAAQTIGWDVKEFDGKGNPRSQNEAILGAVSWGAQVIIAYSIDPALVQQGLKVAKQAGVVLISGNNATGSPNPVITPAAGNIGFDVDVSSNFVDQGRSVADWMIVDSNQKANIFVIGDEEFSSASAIVTGLRQEMALCSTCQMSETMLITADQVGAPVAQMVTSYLQTHPDVDYVYAPYDPVASAIVPAIQQAGLGTKVKVVSAVGALENLAFIQQGRVQVADLASDLIYVGWASVDQAVRKIGGQPFATPGGENAPWALVDKENLPTNKDGLYVPSFDYQAKYKALWSSG